ncbi:MAG: hypothetical protein RML40_10055 [Bacteroidota bacterium]|nr:hypothetical protein [Candidatus Kapabacteria bacterium]MDW8220862.1 hypothetical protein [Bacteroidota bacterium]
MSINITQKLVGICVVLLLEVTIFVAVFVPMCLERQMLSSLEEGAQTAGLVLASGIASSAGVR